MPSKQTLLMEKIFQLMAAVVLAKHGIHVDIGYMYDDAGTVAFRCKYKDMAKLKQIIEEEAKFTISKEVVIADHIDSDVDIHGYDVVFKEIE